MGGVLIPEIRDFDGAARQPDLCRELGALGISEPEAFIQEAGTRLRGAYRALEPERTQPDPEVLFAELDPEARRLLLAGFAREETKPVFPYARDVVRELARDYRLGIASNTIVPGDHHARALREQGILEFIDAPVWSANFGSRKPAPAIIEHVLEKLGSRPGTRSSWATRSAPTSPAPTAQASGRSGCGDREASIRTRRLPTS